ncbi:MAG TPA: metallophosphoesterase [Neobacillus sp.]
MGIYVYLLLITITIDLTLLIGRLFNIISTPINGNIHFFSGLIIVLAVFGLCSYGNYHANQIKNVSYDIQIPKKMLNDNLRIIMLSDLHLGYTNDVAYLKKVVDRINSMEPDIVCIVGDIFNGSYHALVDAGKAEGLMRGIQSTYGVYASLGNHDAGPTYNEMISFFEKSEITLLNDENTIIADQIVLVGRKDSSPIGGQGEERTSISDQLAQIQSDLPIIVMDHQPSNISEYSGIVDLILSGHTHKGQIFPASLITKAIYEVDYGYYQKEQDSPQVIVTSGIGTWGPPMRIGTDSEIVEILINPLSSAVD